MAEAALTFLSERCCEWLSTEMLQWLDGYDVDDKVRPLKEKIQWLSAFLKDVDDRSIDNERAKLWVSTIRDIAYDAEDIVDDFIDMARHKKRVRYLSFFWNPLPDAAKKIDAIISRLSEAINMKRDFGIGRFHASTSRRGKKIPPIVEELNVVGLDDDASMLAKQLTEGATWRSVVSIVGMGGVGKTTLAKKLYNSRDIKKQFDHHAWVYVSQDYSAREILKGIIKSIVTQKKKDVDLIEKMRGSELRLQFRENLKGNRDLTIHDAVHSREPRIKVEQRQRQQEILKGKRELAVHDGVLRREPRIKVERRQNQQEHLEVKRESVVHDGVLRREPRIKVERSQNQQERLEGKRKLAVHDDVSKREPRIKAEQRQSQQELLVGKRELTVHDDVLGREQGIKVERSHSQQELLEGKRELVVHDDVLRREQGIKVERRHSQQELLEGKRELVAHDDVLRRQPKIKVEWRQSQQEPLEGNGILMALSEMSSIEAWFELLDKMSVNELRQKLYELLEGKSYMVVLDDMWQKEAWDVLAAAFPMGQIRSRILLSTRKRDVALHADNAQGFVHEMGFLSEADSWKLLCSKAFVRDSTRTCPKNLETYGKDIVAKCGGLPLAIVMLGGLLSTKGNHPFEWARVLKRVHWLLREGENQIAGILALSYYDLPYHLKSCFLYLGAFPEDSEIRSSTLIKLWAAEGFIPQRGDETIEDAAEDCLNELVSRSMVQLTTTNSYGAVKTCRIHDLLRDLSISKSKEAKFLQRYMNVKPISPTNARRLAVAHQDLRDGINDNLTARHLRSLLQFPTDTMSPTQVQEHHIVRGYFRFLRVLNLDSVNIYSKYIDDVANLVHLRYLGLRNTHLEDLPHPMSNLYNLQTLDIRNTNITGLPQEIWELKRVRHLRAENIQFEEPEGAAASHFIEPEYLRRGTVISHAQLDNFFSLQTLTGVEVGNWMEDELEKLTNLTKLSMWGKFSPYNNLFSKVKFACLKSLKLIANINGSIPTLSCFSHNQHLYSMHLQGRMETRSHLHQAPQNLNKLTLIGSCLNQESLATLEMLQNLRILTLGKSSYIENEMVFSARGFPCLHVLRLHDLEELNEWRVVEGAMPALRRLEICFCRNLSSLPEGLQQLTKLHEFTIIAPPSLKSRLKEDDGDDWYKIRHIPSINIK